MKNYYNIPFTPMPSPKPTREMMDKELQQIMDKPQNQNQLLMALIEKIFRRTN